MKTRIFAIILLISAFGVGYFNYLSEFKSEQGQVHYYPFKLGLDLNGGTHLVYKANTSELVSSEVGDAMESLRDVIERRVNLFGVSEPIVQIESGSAFAGKGAEQKLIVELPGVTDVSKAVELIGKTPVLEFKLITRADAEKLEGKTPEEQTLAVHTIAAPTGLTGRLLKKAQIEFNQNTGEPAVTLTFNDEGKELFRTLTKNHVGDILAIFLDGNIIQTPYIQEEIREGKAQITGLFAIDEAKVLVRNLNYGALPIPVELISTQSVGASLGQDALKGSIRAGLWAFIIIALFLILWYRIPGLIAVIALALYVTLSLAVFKIGISPAAIILFALFFILALTVHWSFGILAVGSYIGLAFIPGALSPVTLTSAGIAGFILSIGMAVDANILIFERMKEELAGGKTVFEAIQEGFKRAWLSIRDSNISSLITAGILFLIPSSSVIKGFALVFGIGVLISMFTAITATRTFLLAIVAQKSGSFARFLFNNGFGRSIK